MLIDAEMVVIDDETLAAGLVEGVLDMKGTDVQYGDWFQKRKDTGRGTGTTVLVHTVIRPDTGDGGIAAGDVTITLSIDDATDPTTVVEVATFDTALWDENQSFHAVMHLPHDIPGRYLKAAIDASAVTGLGTNPRCTTWLFPL